MVLLHERIFSDDHPAVDFFHDLETTAYYLNESSSSRLSRLIIESILRWADHLILEVVRPMYCGFTFLT